MALRTKCPQCGQSLKYPASSKTIVASCPRCETRVRLKGSQPRDRELELKERELDIRERELEVRREPVIVRTPVQQWNPVAAMLLSLIFPGLGQIYKGETLLGLACMVAVPLGYIMFIFPGIILHLLCIVTAAMGDPYK